MPRDNKVVVALVPAGVASGMMDHSVDQLEESCLLEIAGRAVKVSADDPWPVDAIEASGNVVKQGEVVRAGGPSSVVQISRAKVDAASAYSTNFSDNEAMAPLTVRGARGLRRAGMLPGNDTHAG